MALAAATAAGVLVGTRFAVAPAWVAAALCLAVACLVSGRQSRGGARRSRGSAAGILVLGTLLAAGAAAASVRVAAVRGGMLLGRVGEPERLELGGTVAEEPRRLRYGGHWVVLTIDRIQLDGRTWRTRERAGVVLAPTRRATEGRLGTAGGERAAVVVAPTRRATDGRLGPGGGELLAVGDRLEVRASVGRARWADPVGRRPPVVLRNPTMGSWAPASSPALRASEAVRSEARQRTLETLAPERAGLLVGMALGDTSLLPPELDRDFRAAGLTHLMAVSGANVAVVLGAGLWLAGMAGAGRRSVAAIGIMLVVLLVVVTRWEPSVLRAGVMAGLVLLGVATGRGPGGRRALCLAVVALLLADPGLAGALGFQLSVAATAGVLWFGPAAARPLPWWIPERARTAVGVTLGAQAAAAPALALTLGQVSLAGLPANLLGLPLAGGPMLLGVIVAATAPVAPWVATVACRLADPFLIALIAVARWAATLPASSVTLAGPTRAAPAAAVALVVLVIAVRRRRRWAVGPRPPPRLDRCWCEAAEGVANTENAARVGVTRQTVLTWRAWSRPSRIRSRPNRNSLP
ncbi:MAG TPA: ComEC/Rec2 family competence protein [Actinomycetes bacterium]|nr:ComEC/Rec2 family competence protein [Actinomycetes bacterium]